MTPDPASMTWSDEPQRMSRVPWAMLMCLGLLLGVEIFVRGQKPSGVIPYQNTGRQSYSAVRNYLASDGPARVAFLGSSRGRAVIMVPDVRKAIKEEFGRHVRVANYSSAGAAADECDQILRLILRQKTKPEIVLYGVTPMQLSVIALNTTHAGELWFLQDWWREMQKSRARQGALIEQMAQAETRRERRRFNRLASDPLHLRVLPDVIRNEIGLYYRTFGYRDQAANLVNMLFNGERRTPCPINGEYSDHQKRKQQRNLAERPVPERRVRDYLAKRMEDGQYPLGGEQLAHLQSMIDQCREAGVQFIVFEIPVAQILQDNMPPGTMETFHEMVSKVTSVMGVRYVRLEELGLAFTDADFREQSHVNNSGAEKVSLALARDVITPVLFARGATEPGHGESAGGTVARSRPTTQQHRQE